MWKLKFITEENFYAHIKATIQQYGNHQESYNLKRFNANTIDPIKLIFDKTVYRFTWDEIVKNEIFRQRDKSNNNNIGYFHQRIFQYITHCEVPAAGWDVVFSRDSGIDAADGDIVRRVFVEMKNKHNTMNSSASGKTYIKMQSQLLSDDDCACFLVEAIAQKSQNIPWAVSVDGELKKHRRIRRVSMDQFYALATGEPDAFYKICMALPSAVEAIVNASHEITASNDTALEELHAIAKKKNGSFALALYRLGFPSYYGFGLP